MKNVLLFSSLLLVTSNIVYAQDNAKSSIETYKSLEPIKQKEFRELFLDSYVELLNEKMPNKFDNYTTLTKAYTQNSNLYFEYTINSEGMKLLDKNDNAKYFMQEMSMKEVCKKKESQALWTLDITLHYTYYYVNKNNLIKLHNFSIRKKDCLEQRI